MLPQSYNDLIDKAQKTKLYNNLIEQLNKDFLYANVELMLRVSDSPNQIKQHLYNIVLNLIQERFGDYLNLLYTIDVSEAKVKALDGSDLNKLTEQVVFLILQREWQKVWLKYQYGSKTKT